MQRNKHLNEIRQQTIHWDVLIIGGGATGVYTALDSASRGYKTLLLEAEDFGSGPSSRSTKLIHGGVRYLKNLDLKLIREALTERALLLKNASHLVYPLPFILPCQSSWERLFYGAGLQLYDMLDPIYALPKTEWLNSAELEAACEGIEKGKRPYGLKYYDAGCDDARLNISIAKSAAEQGCILANYVRVVELTKQSGKITGALAQDVWTKEKFPIQAKCVINATGTFLDAVAKLDDPHARPRLKLSRGSHLILPRDFYNGQTAIVVPKTTDGRVFFMVPWQEHLLLGTTDEYASEPKYHPKVTEREMRFILETASSYLVKKPTTDDLLSSWAGQRPLINSKKRATKQLSRRHLLTMSQSGLIHIGGGKLTIARRMAEDTLDFAISNGLLSASPSRTKDLPLAGGFPTLLPSIGASDHLPSAVDGDRIHPELPYRWEHLRYAIENEMAMTVEDLLYRRSRARFLNERATRSIWKEVELFLLNHSA